MKFVIMVVLSTLLGGCMGTTFIASDIPGVAALVAKATMPDCGDAAYEERDVRTRTTRTHNVRTEVRQKCVYR